MNRNLFLETCKFDLPSPTSHQNALDHNNRIITYEQVSAPNNAEEIHRFNLTTKHHSLEINSKLDNVFDGLNVKSASLPIPANRSNNKGSDKELYKSRRHERECISHSYMNLSSDDNDNEEQNYDGKYFIEAFILKVGPAPLDDTQHSTNNMTMIVSQSSSILEKKKDDIENSSKMAVSAAEREDEYHLVVRGYLPPSLFASDADVGSKNCVDHNIDEGILEEDSNEKQTKQTKPSTKTNIKVDSKKKSQNKSKKKKRTHSICNHTSSILLSKKSSFVQLCITEQTNRTEGSHSTRTSTILPLSLFVSEGTNLILYQVSTIPRNTDILSSSSIGSFHITKSTLTVDPSITKCITKGDEFVSLLLEEEPSSSHSKDENESNILELGNEVKALDTIYIKDDNNSIKTYLAIGCENGLIRILSFAPLRKDSSDESIYLVHSRNEFSIDGSVKVVYLTVCHEENCVDLAVGSSCGYACLFRDPLNIDQSFYQEPLMLMEGIWNPKRKDDDVVTSICKIPCINNGNVDTYALGTQSGHVFLVNNQSRDGGNNPCGYEFTCLWYIYLYHPIHAISFALKQNIPVLIVITKDTVHWFSLNNTDND